MPTGTAPRFVKSLAEKLLIASGIPSIGRMRHRDDTLILAYHNVLPPGLRASGDASLHLKHSDFVRQLDVLGKYDVVPLTSIHERRSRPSRARVVITFDDAYLGAVTIAASELGRRGLPATIFVAPGLLGRHTWWDAVATAHENVLPDAVRKRALTEFAGMGEAIVDGVGVQALLPSEELRIATEQEITAAVQANSGITLGAHTWSHCNLTALSPTEVHQELSSSMEWLRERFGAFVPWLSYPYGLFSNDIQRAAEAVGYAGALAIRGGWRPHGHGSAFATPRYNVPSGLSIDGFRLRLGGLLTGA